MRCTQILENSWGPRLRFQHWHADGLNERLVSPAALAIKHLLNSQILKHKKSTEKKLQLSTCKLKSTLQPCMETQMTFISGQYCGDPSIFKESRYTIVLLLFTKNGRINERIKLLNNEEVTIHPTISETGIRLFTLKIMQEEVPHGKILTTLGANAFCQKLSVYHRHSLLYSCPLSLNKTRAQEKCHLVVRDLLILVIGLSRVQSRQ